MHYTTLYKQLRRMATPQLMDYIHSSDINTIRTKARYFNSASA